MTAGAPGDAKRLRRILVALFLAALGARAGHEILAPMSLAMRVEGNPWGDARYYDTLAREVAEGRDYLLDGLRAYCPPGYPLFVAAHYALFGERPWIVAAVQVLLGALTVVLLFDAGRRLVPRAAALLAAAILAVHPDFLTRAGFLETETLGAFALTLALWLCVTRRPLLAGLAAGAAVLARIPALFPAAVLGLWWLGTEVTWKRRFLAGALFALGIAAPLAPWAARNTTVLGSPTISVSMGAWLAHEGTQHVKVDNEDLADCRWRHAGRPEAEWYRNEMNAAREAIRSDPRRYLHLCRVRAMRFWYPPIDWAYLGRPHGAALTALAFLALGAALSGVPRPWAFGLAAIGLAGIAPAWRWDPHLFGPQAACALALAPAILAWRRSLWLLALAVAACVPYVLTSVVYRYRFVTEGALLLFAAAGAVWLGAAIRARSWRPPLAPDPPEPDTTIRWIATPVLAVTALLAVGLGVVGYRQAISPRPDPYRIQASRLPPPTEGVLAQLDYERLTRYRQEHLGHVDDYVGKPVDWVGVVRYALSEADLPRIVRFDAPEDTRAIFFLWLFEVGGAEALPPREVVVFSSAPLPDGVGDGSAVRVRGTVRGTEGHRGLVIDAEAVAPW